MKHASQFPSFKISRVCPVIPCLEVPFPAPGGLFTDGHVKGGGACLDSDLGFFEFHSLLRAALAAIHVSHN